MGRQAGVSGGLTFPAISAVFGLHRPPDRRLATDNRRLT